MAMIHSELSIAASPIPISTEHPCYRPPSLPPPNDWMVSLKTDGTPASSWSDCVWDFSAWAGKSLRLRFDKPKLHPRNEYILRVVATLLIWWPVYKLSWNTIRSRFNSIKRLVCMCDRENISASDLSRFPELIEKFGKELKASWKSTDVLYLDRLIMFQDQIGFKILDEAGISILAKAIGEKKESDQTPYIPPRIWNYQIERLSDCLSDYWVHRERIEACFNYCVDAYAASVSSGDLSDFYVLRRSRKKLKSPLFSGPGKANRDSVENFEDILNRFDLMELFDKWVTTNPTGNGWTIKSLTSYLGMVQLAGIAFIITFTLMRKEEVSSLRADCLQWHDTELGFFPVIHGETTKTNPDSDARWVTSDVIETALHPLISIARLRVRCAQAAGVEEGNCGDFMNPLVWTSAYEPWMPVLATRSDYSVRKVIPN
ncbi:hypothetical protein [Bordetella genomosp. 12]|uniref:hypothetical protein n=1 Tax=Bordetella genomosp. 12 TaxID=463035 RepID=UPI00117779FD|nr:hypothetical protein [Bordetella genomosp. 12]